MSRGLKKVFKEELDKKSKNPVDKHEAEQAIIYNQSLYNCTTSSVIYEWTHQRQ